MSDLEMHVRQLVREIVREELADLLRFDRAARRWLREAA